VPAPDGRAGDANAAWRVTARERLVETRWVSLDREAVLLPNGARLDDFMVVHEPDFAIVVALTEERRVLLVRQYRHGIGRMAIELPAGIIDGAEDAADAIAREVREETGHAAAAIRRLGVLGCNPVRTPRQGHVFLATGCRRVGAQALEASEQIEVLTVSIPEARAMIRDGTIAMQSTIAALYLALDALGELRP
jgi:ADP-ribose pyrophosphatase